MATKRTSPKKTGKSKPVVVAEERKTIEREVFDWGVRLTARPFHGTENHAMMIRSEVGNYKTGRGSEVRITFPAASMQAPLRLLDAQTFGEALTAIIADTRAVQSEIRTAASSASKKKR
jgi:hypothetical protein